jgi:adenosyl cobinamide kinase/adenosyl cobinamide phosphate guanylyltransferase
MIVLVIGGTRSGKSEVAEQIAGRFGGAVTYIATGATSDPDIAARIARHQLRRPPDWVTVEPPADLMQTLRDARGTVLLDSLGTWIASKTDFALESAALNEVLRAREGHTIVVSEEVGLSVHPTTASGREFVDRLGTLNRAVAQIADEALLVVAGRVLRLHEVGAVLDEGAR